MKDWNRTKDVGMKGELLTKRSFRKMPRNGISLKFINPNFKNLKFSTILFYYGFTKCKFYSISN